MQLAEALREWLDAGERQRLADLLTGGGPGRWVLPGVERFLRVRKAAFFCQTVRPSGCFNRGIKGAVCAEPAGGCSETASRAKTERRNFRQSTN